MGLKHEAKKGTVIEVNGVKITVLRGSPTLEITAPPQFPIKTSRLNGVSRKSNQRTKRLQYRANQ